MVDNFESLRINKSSTFIITSLLRSVVREKTQEVHIVWSELEVLLGDSIRPSNGVRVYPSVWCPFRRPNLGPWTGVQVYMGPDVVKEDLFFSPLLVVR